MKGQLNNPIRIILEDSIAHSIAKEQRLRADTENRLNGLQNEHQIATADLIGLFRGVLEIQRQQDSIAADRYYLLKF